jgi:hypothetical protein
MDEQTKQVIFGSVLGDGSIGKNKSKFYYQEAHSVKQKEYILWKSNILKKNFKISVSQPYKTNKNKDYKAIRMISGVAEIFTKLHSTFYKEGRKVLKRKVLNQLKPLGLAVWYCDDGSYSYRNRHAKIATMCFSYKEHIEIQKYFYEVWKVNSMIYKEKNDQYIIRFSAEGTRRFISIIENFIPRCMWYKLGPLKSINSSRIKEAKEKRIKYYKEYIKRNYEKELIRQRRYKEKNKEKIKAYRRRPEVIERHRKYMRMYRLKKNECHHQYTGIQRREKHRKSY